MESSCPRPTWKLSIAFAGLCWLMVRGAYRELVSTDGGWLSWVWPFTFLCAGVWLSWVGIFKTAGMQLFWGWMCLLAGGIIIAVLAGGPLFGWTTASRLPTGFILLGTIGMPITGWLLAIDRDVARYRTHLRNLKTNVANRDSGINQTTNEI